MIVNAPWLVPRGFAAVTFWPFIFVKADALNSPKNVGLLAHEGTHYIRQRKVTPFVWWFRYFVNKDFRVFEEVLAIKKQIALGLPVSIAAQQLQRYDEDLTLTEATLLLTV